MYRFVVNTRFVRSRTKGDLEVMYGQEKIGSGLLQHKHMFLRLGANDDPLAMIVKQDLGILNMMAKTVEKHQLANCEMYVWNKETLKVLDGLSIFNNLMNVELAKLLVNVMKTLNFKIKQADNSPTCKALKSQEFNEQYIQNTEIVTKTNEYPFLVAKARERAERETKEKIQKLYTDLEVVKGEGKLTKEFHCTCIDENLGKLLAEGKISAEEAEQVLRLHDNSLILKAEEKRITCPKCEAIFNVEPKVERCACGAEYYYYKFGEISGCRRCHRSFVD